ncbi:hypothetical protein J1605_003473 [Eschrichtius robustus]|uniref:G-protein coupled receptors family 1 profile domain-containing protein n=1 Tax=Eschrichtius robustus TaxID=9764 RepID=A0AB34HPD5_ESCRO|nr:hypothetical protein J1605_003473 [Eschrichtius robustus]
MDTGSNPASTYQLSKSLGLPVLMVFIVKQGSVRERCLEEQKRRRQRATRKISTFIGTFLVCFAPYVITRKAQLGILSPDTLQSQCHVPPAQGPGSVLHAQPGGPACPTAPGICHG